MKTLTTQEDKNILRKKALAKRLSDPFLEKREPISKQIVLKIINSEYFKNAKHIALYLPIKNEIDLTSLLQTKNKSFYLPRCKDLDLEFVKFDKKEELIKNKWGILEPRGKKINPEILDIIYIPALAANKNNYRIGYGKGFYDRFFNSQNIKAKKIIVIASDFIFEDFKEDKFDVQCDLILHE